MTAQIIEQENCFNLCCSYHLVNMPTSSICKLFKSYIQRRELLSVHPCQILLHSNNVNTPTQIQQLWLRDQSLWPTLSNRGYSSQSSDLATEHQPESTQSSPTYTAQSDNNPLTAEVAIMVTQGNYDRKAFFFPK